MKLFLLTSLEKFLLFIGLGKIFLLLHIRKNDLFWRNIIMEFFSPYWSRGVFTFYWPRKNFLLFDIRKTTYSGRILLQNFFFLTDLGKFFLFIDLGKIFLLFDIRKTTYSKGILLFNFFSYWSRKVFHFYWLRKVVWIIFPPYLLRKILPCCWPMKMSYSETLLGKFFFLLA